jgi:hypothetical protein
VANGLEFVALRSLFLIAWLADDVILRFMGGFLCFGGETPSWAVWAQSGMANEEGVAGCAWTISVDSGNERRHIVQINNSVPSRQPVSDSINIFLYTAALCFLKLCSHPILGPTGPDNPQCSFP